MGIFFAATKLKKKKNKLCQKALRRFEDMLCTRINYARNIDFKYRSGLHTLSYK